MRQSGRPSRRPTLEESAALDDVVREAAVDSFLEHGFSGTTMDGVARAAGVTRATLYARYPDKQSLFVEVLRWALRQDQAEAAPPVPDQDDLRASLLGIGRVAMAKAVDPRSVRLSLLLMSESRRFPALVPKDHHLARQPQVQVVVEVLRRHRSAGALVADDLELAAEQFLAIVVSHPARLAAFGLRRDHDVEERYLQHAVDLFLGGVRARP
jgi:AcrR family transcriptional regulator